MNNYLAKQLELVLDFVERHNKQDADREVAEAASALQAYLLTYDPTNE